MATWRIQCPVVLTTREYGKDGVVQCLAQTIDSTEYCMDERTKVVH